MMKNLMIEAELHQKEGTMQAMTHTEWILRQTTIAWTELPISSRPMTLVILRWKQSDKGRMRLLAS